MLENIRIVLVSPSHPGNMGSVARAMKNMGLSDLVLVNPEVYPNDQARAVAVGAVDILNKARIVETLEEALQGCKMIFGTSARVRALEKPLVTPREAATELVSQEKAAILFGRESSGLTNEELSICHKHIVIPTDENFSSLNLAAAAQILSYECFLASKIYATETHERVLAPADQLLGFYTHLQKTLTEIEFIDPKQPRQLMMRLRRLFNRAALDSTEINILRGILSQVDWVKKDCAGSKN